MIDEQIKELTDLSAELSKKSDELNGLIRGVENRINEAKPGFTFWLKDSLPSGWTLGYTQINDRWVLAVRNGAGGDEIGTLLNASRLVRLEAAGQIHAVVVGMCQRASEFLHQIQAAKDLIPTPKGVSP